MASEIERKPGRPKNLAAAGKRREEILSSASRMFATHGYAETNVDHLAAELDLSKGTIYQYFSSKSELLFATADREFQHRQSSPSWRGMLKLNEALAQAFFICSPQQISECFSPSGQGQAFS